MTSERISALPAAPPRPGGARLWVLGVYPLALIALLVLLVLRLGPLGVFQAAFPPVEDLTITRVRLTPGQFQVHVTNGGADPVTIAQVLVDEAYWEHTVAPQRTIPRLGSATVTIPYPWVKGEAHEIVLVTATGLTFRHTVHVAALSPQPTRAFLLTFTLLGVYVGVLPVCLGMLWFPFLRALGRRWIHFFLALTAGLLVFLGVDALAEALETATALPTAYHGTALVAVGTLGAVMLLVVASRLAARRGPRPLVVAYLIALGIGLHNLGEGLAIGAAFNLGEVALGAFLVIGFMLHNTTEGLGIVAPLARTQMGVSHLVLLGLVAGGPTVLGAWVGGFTYSPVLATLFLALGAGAIFQVVYEIGRLMASDAAEGLATALNAGGFVLGLLVMYVTGLLVAL